jgi:hypothetical protein
VTEQSHGSFILFPLWWQLTEDVKEQEDRSSSHFINMVMLGVVGFEINAALLVG